MGSIGGRIIPPLCLHLPQQNHALKVWSVPDTVDAVMTKNYDRVTETIVASVKEILDKTTNGIGPGGVTEKIAEDIVGRICHPDTVWALRLLLCRVPEASKPKPTLGSFAASWLPSETPVGKKRYLYSTILHLYWAVKTEGSSVDLIFRVGKGVGEEKWEKLNLSVR